MSGTQEERMAATRAAKAELRRRMAAIRDGLAPAERAAADNAIRARLLALPEWSAARSIFLYISFRSEVGTLDLLHAALAEGRRVLAPRVDTLRGEMDACRVGSPEDLHPGAWGILEPDGPPVDPETIDLVIVPGLAFDARGARLGYGAGFYDRYLRRVRTGCARVALAYEPQVVPAVPCLPGDERVHLIVTEARVLRTSE